MPPDARISSDEIAKDSALLSLTEMGWGSLLHGFHIPFAGHVLSLNQGFLLAHFVSSRRLRKGVRTAPLLISQYAALLKSLSPMGKRLTPMLAISMQGALFSFGLIVFGANIWGTTLGLFLLSLWGFLQPAVLYLFFFGMGLVGALSKVAETLKLPADTLLWIVLSVILFKALVSIALGLFAFRLHGSSLVSYRRDLTRHAKERGGLRQTPMRSALHEILRPSFLFALLLTGVFLFYAESDPAKIAYGILRPLAIAFSCYWAFQWLPIERWVKAKPDSVFALTLKYAKRVQKDPL